MDTTNLLAVSLSTILALPACDYEPAAPIEHDRPDEIGPSSLLHQVDFAPASVMITPDSADGAVIIEVFDAGAQAIAVLTLEYVADGSAVLGSAEFSDGAVRQKWEDLHSGGVQITDSGASAAEIDRRLALIEATITADPLASGWSCGARFAAWLVACSATIIGCAVAGWPMACECAQWLEKKRGGGSVLEGGLCEDL